MLLFHDALGLLLDCRCGHAIGSHAAACDAENCGCPLDRDSVLAQAIRIQYPHSAAVQPAFDFPRRAPVVNRRKPVRASA